MLDDGLKEWPQDGESDTWLKTLYEDSYVEGGPPSIPPSVFFLMLSILLRFNRTEFYREGFFSIRQHRLERFEQSKNFDTEGDLAFDRAGWMQLETTLRPLTGHSMASLAESGFGWRSVAQSRIGRQPSLPSRE